MPVLMLYVLVFCEHPDHRMNVRGVATHGFVLSGFVTARPPKIAS